METVQLDPKWEYGPVETTEGETQRMGSLPAKDVIERVNEILGYDLLEVSEMARGYYEQAEESLRISESNIAAGFEALPPE
jgi:hypothetical protein